MKEFDRVIGYKDIKEELYQIIDIFKNEKKYSRIGARLVHGLLISGKPGTGKSLLIDCLIKECGVKTYFLKKRKSRILTLNEINRVFEESMESNEPTIIAFDDLDKFSESQDDSYDDEIFVAVQSGIDMVKDNKVLVVATVNNIYKLPESLIRTGRFDRKIEINKPSHEDAAQIIKYYLSTKKVSPDLNYDDLSRLINYTSCSDLEQIINESAIYTAYDNRKYIEMKDIIKAQLKLNHNYPTGHFECDDSELYKTCLHEAAHCLVAESVKPGSVGFVYVAVTGEQMAEGYTSIYNELRSRPDCVLVALAGKASVETFYEGRCESGCQSDLTSAMSLLRDGIAESGTLGIGSLKTLLNSDRISPKAKEELEYSVKNEMERYMFIVKDILIKNKVLLEKLTEKLFENKMLLTSEIKALIDEYGIINYKI